MRFHAKTLVPPLTAFLLLFNTACSDGSDKTEGSAPTTPPTTASPTESQLSPADTAQAINAVKDNWETCISAVGASSSSATVVPIDDTKTGRPIDKGKRPVVVHVDWDGKQADFLVALEGHLTGAALYGDVARDMVAKAKTAGGQC